MPLEVADYFLSELAKVLSKKIIFPNSLPFFLFGNSAFAASSRTKTKPPN